MRSFTATSHSAFRPREETTPDIAFATILFLIWLVKYFNFRKLTFFFSSELLLFICNMERTTQPKRSILPVGYRFHPTDAELVGHFLNMKILGYSDNEDMPIAEVKICDFEPWDLPDQSKIKSNDKVWYFFCPRDFKYLNSRRNKWTTKAGYWKPTGKPRKVKAIGTRKVIGTKRSLVFYDKTHANSKPVKTKWIMHEYESIPVQGNFLICKLKSKLNENVKKVETKEIAPVSASASTSASESVMTVYSSCGECDNAGADFEGHDLDETPAV